MSNNQISKEAFLAPLVETQQKLDHQMEEAKLTRKMLAQVIHQTRSMQQFLPIPQRNQMLFPLESLLEDNYARLESLIEQLNKVRTALGFSAQALLHARPPYMEEALSKVYALVLKVKEIQTELQCAREESEASHSAMLKE